MKIDSAIKDFTERYDYEMLQSIEDLSNKRELVLTGSKINLCNMNESFNRFNDYLKGYAGYKVKNKNNPEITDHDTIMNTVNDFVSNELFNEEVEVKYSELPTFVKSYIEGVNNILNTVNETKSLLTDAEVNVESVAAINDISDKFINKLNESFHEDMNKILWASGYNSRQKLFGKHEKDKKPVFV